MAETGPRWITEALLAEFGAEGTDAHRVCSARGGWAERFGRDFLVSWRDAGFRDAMRAGLGAWAKGSGLALDRIFERELPRRAEARSAPTLVLGDAAMPAEGVAVERGMRFLIDFAGGYSVGLFPDQRGNRALVRQWRPGKTLNLFAYTCSFSVAAAMGGGHATSVDLSRKSLDRGRGNFAANGLDPGAHTFIAADALRLLPRMERRGERYDCVIVDPPTFSRGEGGRAFRVERDMADLALAALRLVGTRGRLLLATNCGTMDEADLRAAARYALEATRRGAEMHAEPPPPDVPPDQAAKTLWVLAKD